jgi:hypothetical protein
MVTYEVQTSLSLSLSLSLSHTHTHTLHQGLFRLSWGNFRASSLLCGKKIVLWDQYPIGDFPPFNFWTRGPIRTERSRKLMPLETTPNQYSQFPKNMVDAPGRWKQHLWHWRSSKNIQLQEGTLFLFRAKNTNADVRNFHLGFTGKTPTINKQLELHYKTFLQ